MQTPKTWKPQERRITERPWSKRITNSDLQRARCCPLLTGVEHKFTTMMLEFGGGTETGCRMGVKTMAAKLGTTEGNIRVIMHRLKAKGILASVQMDEGRNYHRRFVNVHLIWESTKNVKGLKVTDAILRDHALRFAQDALFLKEQTTTKSFRVEGIEAVPASSFENGSSQPADQLNPEADQHHPGQDSQPADQLSPTQPTQADTHPGQDSEVADQRNPEPSQPANLTPTPASRIPPRVRRKKLNWRRVLEGTAELTVMERFIPDPDMLTLKSLGTAIRRGRVVAEQLAKLAAMDSSREPLNRYQFMAILRGGACTKREQEEVKRKLADCQKRLSRATDGQIDLQARGLHVWDRDITDYAMNMPRDFDPLNVPLHKCRDVFFMYAAWRVQGRTDEEWFANGKRTVALIENLATSTFATEYLQLRGLYPEAYLGSLGNMWDLHCVRKKHMRDEIEEYRQMTLAPVVYPYAA